MTKEQIIENLSNYTTTLQKQGYIPLRNNNNKLNHILWMCDHAIDQVRKGKLEKANRWFGFIQGALFTNDIFTIEELKEHNRPKVIMEDDY